MTLRIQTCGACGAVQYPSREVCRTCLSDALEWGNKVIEGRVVAETCIHRSLEPERLSEGPLRIGAVATTLGIRVIAALDRDVHVGTVVRLGASEGPAGPILATAHLDTAPGTGAGNDHDA